MCVILGGAGRRLARGSIAADRLSAIPRSALEELDLSLIPAGIVSIMRGRVTLGLRGAELFRDREDSVQGVVRPAAA